MAKRSGTSGKFALGALAAAGIGYAIGILTAPKSGKETRKDLSRKSVRAKKEAERTLKQLHSELANLITQGKVKSSTASKKLQAELNEAVERAQTAKQTAKELLSAIHEGEAENTDLQHAITDSRKAVVHLKNYLKSNVKKPKK